MDKRTCRCRKLQIRPITRSKKTRGPKKKKQPDAKIENTAKDQWQENNRRPKRKIQQEGKTRNTTKGQRQENTWNPKNTKQPEAKTKNTAGDHRQENSQRPKKNKTAGGQKQKYSRRPTTRKQPEAKEKKTAGGQNPKYSRRPIIRKQPEAKEKKTAGGQNPEYSRRPTPRKQPEAKSHKHSRKNASQRESHQLEGQNTKIQPAQKTAGKPSHLLEILPAQKTAGNLGYTSTNQIWLGPITLILKFILDILAFGRGRPPSVFRASVYPLRKLQAEAGWVFPWEATHGLRFGEPWTNHPLGRIRLLRELL